MKNDSYAGQKVLITGAASGIGRALAEQLASSGATLFLTDIDTSKLSALAQQLRSRGAVLGAERALDIADQSAVAQFAREIHATHGSMDMVMNVAGISIWGTVDHLKHEHWRRLIEINLMGAIHVIESFVPVMIEAGTGGRLVNVASAAGLLGLPWHAAYSATKFGLRGISEVLRFDLEPHGIGVSLVCPGGVDTGLVDTAELVGVNRESPGAQRLIAHFKKHARSPEQAAQSILKGVAAGRYLIFTSNDIRLCYWLQSYFPPGYRAVMRLLRRRLDNVAISSPALS